MACWHDVLAYLREGKYHPLLSRYYRRPAFALTLSCRGLVGALDTKRDRVLTRTTVRGNGTGLGRKVTFVPARNGNNEKYVEP